MKLKNNDDKKVKVIVYSIYDSVAKIFNQPFFMQNDDMAMRAFSDLKVDVKSMISYHPDDYTLYQVGIFYPECGIMEGCDPHLILDKE